MIFTNNKSRPTKYCHRAVFKGGRLRLHPPPEMLIRKFFGNVKKHAKRMRVLECSRTLCLHYCDVRKSRLESIKCKKPLGRPGLRPRPRWGAYSAPPDPLADGEGAGCPLPKNHTPAFGLSGLTCPRPLIVNPPN